MRICPLLGFAVLALVPSLAMADTQDQFTLIGEGNDFTFTLPATPTPSGIDGSCPSGVDGEFCLDNVSVNIVNGTDTATMEFFDGALGGGLVFDTLALFGPQLYTGDIGNPSFLIGSFPLESGATPFPDYTLQVSTITPEPASWSLLATGLLSSAALLRRRRVI